ncbi:MAG: hypothetical protein SP1CHLAM54_11650 [Chlamydiia bacterium]|nr:hypothetical protein [Chlamydiia bacterium]MCH9616068.1 hypothetical protein [Chlamydiia bacterium]MCH9629091.1 hypothetical protein [Chlamydiia bacterium]
MANPVAAAGVGGGGDVVVEVADDDGGGGVAVAAVGAIAESAAVFGALDELAGRMGGGHFCGLVSDENLGTCERWTRGIYSVVIVAALIFGGLGLFAGMDSGVDWSLVMFCVAGAVSIPSVYLAAEYADRLPGFSQAVAFRATGRRLAEEVDGLRGQVNELEGQVDELEVQVDELEALVADLRGLATRYKAMLRQFGTVRTRLDGSATTIETHVAAMGEAVHSMQDVLGLLQEGSAPFRAVAAALVLAEARIEALEQWEQEARALHPELPAIAGPEALPEV